MSNRWTGAYDGALAVSAAGLDRLLAALHAGGSAFHSLWLNLPLDGGDPTDPLAYRGTVGLALGAPRTVVPTDPRRDRLGLELDLRGYALDRPDRGSVPETFHGLLRIEAPVELTGDGREALLHVDFRDPRSAVVYQGGGRTETAEQRAFVGRQAEHLLRRNVRSVVQRWDLPAPWEVHGWAVRTDPEEGSRPATVGVLFDLSPRRHAEDDPLAPEPILGSSELALALSRELVVARIASAAESALVGVGASFTVQGVDVGISIDGAAADLVDGMVRVSVRGEATADIVLSSPTARFTTAQSFALAVEDGRLEVSPSGSPSVELRHGVIPDFALNAAEREIESALRGPVDRLAEAAGRLLRELFAGVPRLVAGLGLPGAGVALRSVEAGDDGLLLHADLDLPPLDPPVVRFTAGPAVHAPRILELRALPSWIPGGTIRRYRWQALDPEGREVERRVEEDSFVLRLSTGGGDRPTGVVWPPRRWCLAIEGTRAPARPGDRPLVVVERVCPIALHRLAPSPQRSELPLRLDVVDPAGSDPSGAPREPRIVAAVEVDLRPGVASGLPVALWRGGGGDDRRGAEALAKSLRAAGVPALGIVVASDGGKGGMVAIDGLPGLALAGEDALRWAKAFAMRPGTVLALDAAGREVWRDGDGFDPEELAKVIAAAAPAEGSPAGGVELAVLPVRAGDVPPPFQLPHLGRSIGLRKLRGREVTICFWLPSSGPSRAEIERLAVEDLASGKVVIAVHPAAGAEEAAARLAERHPELTLVGDPGGRLARGYGVRVWPTMVRVGRHGRIAGIDYGRGD